MSKIGIICDLTNNRHHLFRSYYHAIGNVFGIPKLITCRNDLNGIKLLFIADDHYEPNKQIWQSPGFIDQCNHNKIHVVTLTNERILHSHFPWNEENYQVLKHFKFLHHLTNDVDDCRQLGTKLNRTAMSRSIQPVIKTDEKADRMVFIGKVECDSYRERRHLLSELKNVINLDIIRSNIPRWEDYMQLIAKYRFVLSPIGNGNFFPMRFYETLYVKSIPVHQVRTNTLKYYDVESRFDDCIFFQTIPELKEKLEGFKLKTSHNVYYMEDNLQPLKSWINGI